MSANPNQYYISQSPASLRTALAQDIGTLFVPLKPTPGELTVGVIVTAPGYPPGNVLRYGLIPNVSGAADANTSILRSLVSYNQHNTGWGGDLVFPNTTGNDIYYFSNYLDFRPGIDVDMQWCTLNFAKTSTDSTDGNSGFVSAIRDFTIRDGYINVNFSCANGGHAMMFGGRGIDGTYFIPIYDSTLAQPMGNIRVSNVKVTTNNPNNYCLFMLGGLQNLSVENFWYDGGGVANGIYYEFGWATDAGGVLANRQTSHAHNMKFRNIKATNLLTGGGGLPAIQCNGAYSTEINGIYVNTAAGVAGFGPGESWFYLPWTSVDDGHVTKRTTTIRNVVGKGITGAGISIVGANTSSVATGFRAAVINALAAPALYIAQSDLESAIIDGFYMNGSSANYAFSLVGAQKIDILNGYTDSFLRGINATAEVINYNIRNCHFLNSASIGINMGAGFPVWTPTRLSTGVIEDCKVAGSGTAGTIAGIAIANSYSCSIKNCVFGYEVVTDGVAETTQAQAVSIATTAAGVVIDNCYVAGTSGGAVAYNMGSLVNSRGNTILNPRGIATLTGPWNGVQINGVFSITYSASMTPDASSARNTITATTGVAFAINAPANTPTILGTKLTLIIRNTSGGALGVATFNATFKMSAWTQPATANSRSITFDWDGTNWVESSRTPADVPN